MFWWVIFPYIAATLMIAGLLYRFIRSPKSWAAPSTEFFEKRWLRIGSPLFHYGIIFAFVGHVMGMLIPRSFYLALGVHDEMYHVFAIAGGGLAGVMVVAGLIILLIRKMSHARLRAHATWADYFAILMVLIVSALGTYITLVYDTTVTAFEYRTTIGPWFRSLFTFQPQYELMEVIPTIFKVHVVSAFLLFAVLPFTMLVHMFSFPARYPTRAPIQYRSRVGYRKGKEPTR
ncbi:MAG: narI1 [Paenibacillaceae bacterium]|jgi:nitrate reductase gamma subunit|nr:narI1 [Paenibacillaceae bacterium]